MNRILKPYYPIKRFIHFLIYIPSAIKKQYKESMGLSYTFKYDKKRKKTIYNLYAWTKS